jgi:hypothetical protein
MSLETVATDYAPLNTPIDGDRDYSDLTGMYQGGVLPQGMLGDCNCPSLDSAAATAPRASTATTVSAAALSVSMPTTSGRGLLWAL